MQDDVHRCSGNAGIVLQLAYQRGYISAEERRRVFGVMRQLGLAIWHEVCTTEVLMQVGPCLCTKGLAWYCMYCISSCVLCMWLFLCFCMLL